jgi:hypothetical protein
MKRASSSDKKWWDYIKPPRPQTFNTEKKQFTSKLSAFSKDERDNSVSSQKGSKKGD